LAVTQQAHARVSCFRSVTAGLWPVDWYGRSSARNRDLQIGAHGVTRPTGTPPSGRWFTAKARKHNARTFFVRA